MPKYVGEGVESRRLPGDPGGPCPRLSCLFRQFCVNALRTRHVRNTSLIFRCYVIWGCHDITCDITASHMHWSHDLLLEKVGQCLIQGSFWLCLGSLGSWFALVTHIRLVSNACRSRRIQRVSGLEPTSFKHNYCVSLGQ